MSGSDPVAVFGGDAAGLTIGVVLCTVAAMLVAFAIVGRGERDRRLLVAGVFALLYGVRLIAASDSFELLTDRPPWLPYFTSSLEYLVPLPGAALFAMIFGPKLRRLNLTVFGLFAVCAAIAIPYELATAEPHAGQPVVDVLVMVLATAFAINLFIVDLRGGRELRALRTGAAVFVLFVINEHVGLVREPLGLTREPAGFLFFIGTIVYVVIREGAETQGRLAGIESELATARRIQESILPHGTPGIEGLDIATRYVPASEVAGDFFDFVDEGEGRVGVFVADVAGHGVPAALVASMLKIALASQSSHVRSPGQLLRALNVLFRGRLGRQFVTAAYGYFESATRRVKVAAAGHPPPLVRRADGRVEEIPVRGVILGRFPNVDFEEASLVVVPGDAVVFYSDGVTERMRGDGEMYGEERLREAIAQAGASAAEIASAISDSADRWAARKQDDDVTVVVVRVT